MIYAPPAGYYDGGDCCAETCVDSDYVCGVDSFLYCLDPEYYVPY